MTNHSTSARSSTARALRAAFSVAMLLGATAACSSDSDSDSKNSSDPVSVGADKPDSAEEPESGSDQDRPDGFPDDIPLPEFSDLNTTMSATDDSPGYWSLVLTIDPSMQESGESIMDAYSTQLQDAGYEVDGAGTGNVEAENEEWTITFHSSMDGTLTISTSPN